jgi:hypothetical protein
LHDRLNCNADTSSICPCILRALLCATARPCGNGLISWLEGEASIELLKDV